MLTRSEIAALVEQEARRVFTEGMPTTIEMKEAFRNLGRNLGYYVAASGCDADDGEWLYDMTWYVESGGFFTILPLALESENNPLQPLDGDFGKLVQARAEVRVWICKLHPRQTLEEHLETYKQQVMRFGGSQKNDTYVFVIYDYPGLKSYIERFVVA